MPRYIEEYGPLPCCRGGSALGLGSYVWRRNRPVWNEGSSARFARLSAPAFLGLGVAVFRFGRGTSCPGRKYAVYGVGAGGRDASYVLMLAGVVDKDEEKATACLMIGRSGGGGVSSSAMGGITRSPSSDVGVNDRFCFSKTCQAKI